MRYEYKNIFKSLYKEEEKNKLKNKNKKSHDTEKVFKMGYHVNILPSMCEDEGTIMDAISKSNELAIYKTDLVKDIIDYKWDNFAFSAHRIGAFMHMTYIICL
jgi:hypothetical protein